MIKEYKKKKEFSLILTTTESLLKAILKYEIINESSLLQMDFTMWCFLLLPEYNEGTSREFFLFFLIQNIITTAFLH
jgi:hypothetical protein